LLDSFFELLRDLLDFDLDESDVFCERELEALCFFDSEERLLLTLLFEPEDESFERDLTIFRSDFWLLVPILVEISFISSLVVRDLKSLSVPGVRFLSFPEPRRLIVGESLAV